MMIALISLGGAFSIFLAILKLAGIFTWSWWVVIAPWAISEILFILSVFCSTKWRERK